ncbi:MAG: hypothetical protein LAT76_11845 [Schleiferiaceae bacterium]|nr:hypothetical protein [Schleiferiaceae bacterium]
MRDELNTDDRKMLEHSLKHSDTRELYIDYLKQHNFKLSQLKSQPNLFLENNPKEGNKKHKFVFGAVVITFVALFLGVNWFVEPNKGESHFNNYYESFPNIISPIVRGDQPKFSDSAFFWYETKNFIAAYQSFEYRYTISKNPDYAFYMALSAIELGNYDVALQVLSTMSESEYALVNVAKEWYTALLLLRKKQEDQAKEILAELANKDNVYRIQSQELLSDL